jgi:hypothetical protein
MRLSQFISGCFGIVGFVVSTIAGLYADNSFNSVLLHAILAAVLCYFLGWVIGLMAQATAAEQARHIADKVAALDAEQEAKKLAREHDDDQNAADAAAAAAQEASGSGSTNAVGT